MWLAAGAAEIPINGIATSREEKQVDFLVEFDIHIPDDAPRSEVEERERGEAAAAAGLAREGHLVRIWKPPAAPGESKALGLYRADTRTQLDGLLGALPLADWMRVSVTLLEPHPNDPANGRPGAFQLPGPRLRPVYRLEAALGAPLDLGATSQGRRRVVALTGGTFTGPELTGRLLPGASADWQIMSPDGTALADLRYTLQTDRGDLLYVQARGVRHGSAEVLARLARGEAVDASEYIFRTSTQIETAVPDLEWLSKGVFVSVGGRQPAGVIYETYLVE
jgi:muconolactone delta-isomerase